MHFTRSNRSHVLTLAVGLLAVALLALPTLAAAQSVSPTDEQYGSGTIGLVAGGNPGGSPGGSGGSGTPETTDVGSIGELPFTGLDIVAIAAIGLGLLGAGFVVRRAAHMPSDLA